MAALEEFSASELLVGPAQSTVAAEDLLRRGTAPVGSDLAMPRAMIVVAHADDETIALGARIERFYEAHFIHVTDGAPRNEQDSRAHGFRSLDDYRQARVQELWGEANERLKSMVRPSLEVVAEHLEACYDRSRWRAAGLVLRLVKLGKSREE